MITYAGASYLVQRNIEKNLPSLKNDVISRPGHLFEENKDFGSTDPERGPARDMAMF